MKNPCGRFKDIDATDGRTKNAWADDERQTTDKFQFHELCYHSQASAILVILLQPNFYIKCSLWQWTQTNKKKWKFTVWPDENININGRNKIKTLILLQFGWYFSKWGTMAIVTLKYWLLPFMPINQVLKYMALFESHKLCDISKFAAGRSQTMKLSLPRGASRTYDAHFISAMAEVALTSFAVIGLTRKRCCERPSSVT